MRLASGRRAGFLAIVFAAAAMAGAAEKARLADKHVVVAPPMAKIHGDDAQSDEVVHGGTVLDVLDEQGDKVLVNRGWLSASDVIPFDRAIDYFGEQIDREPSAVSYASRARVWCYHGDYDKTLADCNEALKLDPDLALAFSRRGRAWAGKGELDKAIADFDAALRLDPKDAHAYTHRARAHNERGDYELAVKDCNAALGLDPKSNVAYYYRGRAWALQGDVDQALADFNQAIKLNHRYVPAYVGRANELLIQHKYEAAITDYNEVIRLNPHLDMVHVHYNRGNAYYRLGDYGLAAADYQESLRHNDKYSPAIEALAQCYAKLGNFNAAAQWQAKAISVTEASRRTPAMQARLKNYQASQNSRPNVSSN